MSGHHSRYRDNYESQVCHIGCQVRTWQGGDIRQVPGDNMVNINTSSESMTSNTRKQYW